MLTVRSPFDDGLSGEAGPDPHRGRASSRAASRAGSRIDARAVRIVQRRAASSRGPDAAGVVARPVRWPAGGRARTGCERAHRTLRRHIAQEPVRPGSHGRVVCRVADYDSATWPEWLAKRGASPEAVRLMTQGGDSSALSALYMLRQFAMLRTSSQLFKIAGGMDRLPQAMASALGDVDPVRSGGRQNLRAAAGSVAIEFESRGRIERLAASHVVLAIPLTTLRQIEFRPRLSAAKEKAIGAVAYYPGVRILLQSRDRFWNRAGLNGSARTARAEIWDCAYDRQGQARGLLGATAGGAVGRKFMDMTRRPEPGIRSRSRRRRFSWDTIRFRKGRRSPVGARPLVARRLRRVRPGSDDGARPGNCTAGRSPAFRGRAHLVVDGLDGRRARVGRARGA